MIMLLTLMLQWVCAMNFWDLAHAACEVPEEAHTNDALLDEEIIAVNDDDAPEQQQQQPDSVALSSESDQKGNAGDEASFSVAADVHTNNNAAADRGEGGTATSEKNEFAAPVSGGGRKEDDKRITLKSEATTSCCLDDPPLSSSSHGGHTSGNPNPNRVLPSFTLSPNACRAWQEELRSTTRRTQRPKARKVESTGSAVPSTSLQETGNNSAAVKSKPKQQGLSGKHMQDRAKGFSASSSAAAAPDMDIPVRTADSGVFSSLPFTNSDTLVSGHRQQASSFPQQAVSHHHQQQQPAQTAPPVASIAQQQALLMALLRNNSGDANFLSSLLKGQVHLNGSTGALPTPQQHQQQLPPAGWCSL